jgi:hypothetical protein
MLYFTLITFRLLADCAAIAAVPIYRECISVVLVQCTHMTVNISFLITIFQEGVGNDFFQLSHTCHI